MRRRLVPAAVAVAIGAFVIAAGVLAQHAFFPGHQAVGLAKYMPQEGDQGEDLDGATGYWTTRLTYPTGKFNPDWIRRAVAQDARVPRAAWTGRGHRVAPGISSADGGAVGGGTGSTALTKAAAAAADVAGPTAAATAPFISLGPKPLAMPSCSSCYNYGNTEGRINAIAVDPTTTTNGSIVAYAASVGGGVWKTINCCTASTSWAVMTDDPMIATTSIDTVAIDPNDHNTVYAGTGDLNYGSFSMGSQGILKSTDGGAHWTVLGQSLFGAQYVGPAGANSFPQYQAVGKVAVDPNNSSIVAAGTKSGLYVSYDAGQSWTGPCLTNSYTAQRQDTTALILSDLGGGKTRILTAVGTRGFSTGVQPDLSSQGANGVYAGTMPAAGCPSFSLLSRNDNGFVYGAAVTGGAGYAAGAPMNGGSGIPYASTTSGNQLGRIDLAVSPQDPQTMYAQVQSEAPNTNSGCASAQGCQLGVWSSIDGGTSWSFMAGSQGASLRNCSNGQGDYNQNWYDQGVAVDPNNPDRILVDTFDIWFATRTGTSFYDLSCGYSYSGSQGPVHTDQHAIAFVPGSSSTVLFGNDGGMRYTTNANTIAVGTRPTFGDLDNGLNTIEYYSGDISANFLTSAKPYANGGAQDNGSSTAIWNGTPTGPAQWQMGTGGDGFFARIDPVGTVMWQGGNSGGVTHCTAGIAICTGTAQSGRWTSARGAWTSDTQSFVLPYEIFKGTPGNPGGQTSTDCTATSCNHLIAGTVRVWETVNGQVTTTPTWYVNSPANLTKQTLGNRSYINQLAYSPATWQLAIVGTNDGNVQIGRNMGTGSNQSTWVNVTGGNAVLPNRPILDVAFDPRSMNTAAAPMIGYAAVGGFTSNTPSTPGHVYQVTCDVNCATATWADKSGNLPDIPADSIIANPKDPQQVYVGTDIGLYVTDDINAATPIWYKLQTGLPNVMIWDLQIDRGSTALSVWTRSRGAYVWPLPSSRLVKLAQTIDFAPIGDHVYGDPDFDVAALASSGVDVTFAASGGCTISGKTVHVVSAGSCTITASAAGNLDYNAAQDVSQTFAIAKAEQTISIASATPKHFGDDDFQVEATASSGLPVTLAADGRCTISATSSPATVHILGGGTCTVTATQGGDDNWKAAPDEVREFDIAKADQTITFASLDDKTYGDGDVTLEATATSGLDVAFSAAGGCEVDGTTLKITGAGDCTVTASQAGDDDWNPAADVTHTFSVAKAAQTITFASLDDRTFGDGDFGLTGTSSSGLDVAYATAGNCTVSGATVHLTGAGSCTITASQPGDENYQAADSVDQEFSIERQSQSISFDAIADITLGDPDVNVAPTSSTGLDVYLVSSGPCAIDSATAPAHVHATGAGTCTITASQPGDADRAPAPSVSRSFAIGKGTQTIAFASLDNRVFGGPFAVAPQSSAGLVVTLAGSGACTVSGSTVTPIDAGTCTLVASQEGDANYQAAASVTRSFTITSSTVGTAAGAALKPLTGGNVVFSADANLPGPKVLGGSLNYDAAGGVFGRSTPPLHVKSKAITALGVAADGHSAWFAGTTTDGQRFVAYAADLTVRPKPHQDSDVFQLWVNGVLQTGDGSLDKGNVAISTR